MKNCKCCGRDFNHTNFPVRLGSLGVLSPLDYACSLRCKNELVDAYNPSESKKQKERAAYLNTLSPEEMTDDELYEANRITVGGFIRGVFSTIFWVGLIVAFLVIGTALGFK